MNSEAITAASESYIRDVAFPSGYNANQNPLRLQYISVLNGFERDPLPDAFHYCDLGCGNGVTLNLLANMFPHANFIGIDFNRQHIEYAAGVAKSAGIKNVKYYNEDFAKLGKLKLPKLDFICCNGTFSWINTQIQEIIKTFVAGSLADNGKFYVEYAAKPGKIQMDPLWHFLREMTLDSIEDSSERVKAGIDYLERLRKNGALFFRQNPVAQAREKTLPQENVASVAHNALTEWQALNHSDIARSLEKQGVFFLGQADFIQNHLELHIPKVFFGEINSLKTSILRETMKDYILNRGLRRDIYIKGKNSCQDDMSRFDALCFGAGRRLNNSFRIYDFGNGHKINFNEPLYKALFDVLNNEVLSFLALKKHKKLKGFDVDKLIHALHMLVAVAYVMPVKATAVYKEHEVDKELVLASKLNDKLLKDSSDINQVLYLDSAISGQVEYLGPVMALFLKAMIEKSDVSPVNYARDRLAEKGFPLQFQNIKLNNPAELEKFLTNVFKVFTENVIPDFMRLGILISAEY